MKMHTFKKPLFFSDKIFEISHQENKINLSEKINDLGYKIEVIANEIYSLAGGVEEKKVFLRNAKKKKKKDKPKKNLVEIFNENAKRKKILGPYLRGANKIEDQIKLLKNILHDDEAMRQDFIKKKKKEEEILKRLDDNYLKNQEMRKLSRKMTIKDDFSIVSGETKDLNLQKNSFFKDNIFNFYKQFSTTITEKESQNNKEENDNIRRGPIKSFGTIKLINNLDVLNKNINNNLINNTEKKESLKNEKINNNTHHRNLSYNINESNKNVQETVNNKVFSPSSKMNLTNNCNFFSAEKTRNNDPINYLNPANTYSYEHFSRTANRFSTNRFNGNNFQMNSTRKISFSEKENKNVDASSENMYNNYQFENKDFINNNISDLNTNPSTTNNGPSISRNKHKKLSLFLQTQEKTKETPLIEKHLNADSTGYFNFNNMAPHSKKNYSCINNPENGESFSKLNLSRNNESSSYMQSIFNTKSNSLFNKENFLNSPNFRSTGLNFTNPNFNICNNNNNSNFNTKISPRNHIHNNQNNKQNTTSPETQSNKNLLTLSYSDGSEAFPKIMNTTSKMNIHKNLFHSNQKNNKNLIAQSITKACTTTSNKARSIKSKIENYTPINKNLINNRKLIDKKFLKPELEKQIKNENDEFRKHRGFFIYPKSLLNPVYISDNNKNVLRESNYVDKLNETKAFAARNLIYNKYKVYIGDEDLYNYTNDIRAEYTHQDKIENYKQKKIKNNSYHIKKMIANTQMINKEINEMYVELKNKKIVSSSVNKS